MCTFGLSPSSGGNSWLVSWVTCSCTATSNSCFRSSRLSDLTTAPAARSASRTLMSELFSSFFELDAEVCPSFFSPILSSVSPSPPAFLLGPCISWLISSRISASNAVSCRTKVSLGRMKVSDCSFFASRPKDRSLALSRGFRRGTVSKASRSASSLPSGSKEIVTPGGAPEVLVPKPVTSRYPLSRSLRIDGVSHPATDHPFSFGSRGAGGARARSESNPTRRATASGSSNKPSAETWSLLANPFSLFRHENAPLL
mmetsp:Transcript_7888/g.26201  ORF Transcript_7888/g.26201 Transcript_7888/m.26201 type:complete len:257 (+) Transcript_7888:53-823(+)